MSSNDNRSNRKQGKNWFPPLLFLIAFLGVLLRLTVVWELRNVQAVTDPPAGTDMRTYWNLASEIIQGRLPEQFYYQPFYYSVFLPIILLLSGGSALALGIAQALIGGLTVWLTGWSSKHLFGWRSGLLSAFCLALAHLHIFYTPFALIAVLHSLWLVLIISAMVWLNQRSSLWRWGLFGLLFGCANLTRGNIIILLPGVAGVLIWQHWRQWRRLAGYAAVFSLVMVTVQMPFSLHNRQRTGQWSGPSTAANAVLALGNNPESPPGGLIYTPTYESWMELARKEGEDRISVPHSIMNWIKEEPFAWFELKLRAGLLFWMPLEIPNNVSPAHEGAASRLLRMPFLLDFWLFASLGLGGAVISLISPAKRRSPPVCFGVFCIAGYCLATVLFYILARFRLPIVPLLCIFAGYALHRFWGEIQVLRRRGLSQRRKQNLAVLILSLLVPALFTIRGFDLYQGYWEARILRRVRPHGVLAKDETKLIIYDHGPKFLGGWTLFPLPGQAVRAEIEKTFSLPANEELAKRRPRVLSLPLQIQSGGKVSVKVDHAGQRAGGLEKSFIPTGDNFQWLDIDLLIEDMEVIWIERSIRFHISIKVDSPQPAYLWVDQQRNYNRTQIITPALPKPAITSDLEACLQLIFH